MTLRILSALVAGIVLAPGGIATVVAQPFPPQPEDQRRAVGDWLVEHMAESDGGRIVRMTRVHNDQVLEYHVAFWRGNGGPVSHVSVERAGQGCGGGDWRRDSRSDIWRAEDDVPGVTRTVRASFASALAECGAAREEVSAALAGFEPAFRLAADWTEVGRLATLAEIEAIENYGRDTNAADENMAAIAEAEADLNETDAMMTDMNEMSAPTPQS